MSFVYIAFVCTKCGPTNQDFKHAHKKGTQHMLMILDVCGFSPAGQSVATSGIGCYEGYWRQKVIGCYH